MDRRVLENKLRALGFAPMGQASGRGHVVWFGRGRRLYVPQDHIVNRDVAAQILADASEE